MTSALSIRSKLRALLVKMGLSCHGYMYERLQKDEEKPKTLKLRKGHFCVLVGEEAKRYEIPVEYFWLPAFETFIQESPIGQEVLDIKIDGPIWLSCKTAEFDQFLKLEKKKKKTKV